jgi:hypothetical protein
MTRLVVIALAVVLVSLAALSLAPRPERPDPVETIDLEAAEVRLFPASDPDAAWRFSAPSASYDPGLLETTLRSIEDGERRVGDEVDFTLAAERLVIGRDDDLRSARMDVHLIADDLDVEMEGEGDRLVRVNQDAGRFEVPNMRIFGDDFGESRYEEMSISFDFTDFQAGGPDTIGYSEFQLDERDEDGDGS